MFDDIAASVASTLSGVFGAVRSYSRGVEFTVDVPVVVRRDIEAIDDAGQVVGRTNTVRIAHSDIDFTPKRGDTIIYGSDTFTLGRRLADDRYAYLFEATT
jgi:hypothetical protein